MRIAQLSPLYESVPPALYGGTERVVSYLTEELVAAGHDVTLFASGDSRTAARLVPICERALRLEGGIIDPSIYHIIMMEEVLKREGSFDIIHSHIEPIGYVLGRRTATPVISTIHGRLDLKEHARIFAEFSSSPLVSISNSQRSPLPGLNWIDTVYHGIPGGLYTFRADPEDYLVYVGRISPEKRVDSAINIARLSGMPLKIAAKVDRADQAHFNDHIRPLLDDPLIEFVGEVSDAEKDRLIGGSLAFLHPVDWPEPFGLSMIEAMACGVPVIARRRGSIPEVVDHGVTGFIFEDDTEAAGYIKNLIPYFSRKLCRARYEERFRSETMAANYMEAYVKLLRGLVLEEGRKL